MCCKMVVVGCIDWVVVGRWLIGYADEEKEERETGFDCERE